MVVFGTRWKNKSSETFALANPMSKIISKLQSSLIQYKACGLLFSRTVDCVVLLEVGLEQADLLNQACFGCCIATTNKDKRHYELSIEEAFYFCHVLQCLEIVWGGKCLKNIDEIWQLMTSKRKLFPIYYKAYSHLRAKHWVVRSEVKYGVDFVAYRHHPSLVHSEYAVLVSTGDDDINTRLLAWASVHATVRLEDGVAKTLLILYVKSNVCDTVPSLCWDHFTVEEQTIARWNPEQWHEDHTIENTTTENCCDSVHNAKSSTHYNFNKFSMHQNNSPTSRSLIMGALSARWKGKGSKATALSNPMSELIIRLQSSLVQSKSYGLLAGSAILVEVGIEQADLLNRACFGCPILTTSKDTHWYELSLEEAFYFSYSLKCTTVMWKNQLMENSDELWEVMKSKRELFPIFYKAYSHLRGKNWVVRSGIQYGVDFVAYLHHPSLVHSEYAVVVLEGNGNKTTRLVDWPDVHATVRLEGGVAKTLLVLYIKTNGFGAASPSCLTQYTVEEEIVNRWNSEQCREGKLGKVGSGKLEISEAWDEKLAGYT